MLKITSAQQAALVDAHEDAFKAKLREFLFVRLSVQASWQRIEDANLPMARALEIAGTLDFRTDMERAAFAFTSLAKGEQTLLADPRFLALAFSPHMDPEIKSRALISLIDNSDQSL